MTRWHDPDCRSPDVFVDDGNLPTCRACGRVCPSTASLVASLNIMPSGVDLPPDEEYGQMNLWWPRDVLYVNQRDPALCTTQDLAGSSAVANIGESLAGVTMDHDLSDQTNSHIYGNTLKSNEFRLACLSAVPREDYPVHLSLETHTYDNRPEYETVSYTWGGESGDSRPSRPVYVGQYWDVILQSHNCWAMLQFARPWRGIRMLWVDALCINQSDLKERATQVARMRQIYGDANRVVVFLGKDMVSTNTNFPVHKTLDEIDSLPFYDHLLPARGQESLGSPPPKSYQQSEPSNNLQKLLQRTYFSRVWVIQELIASDRAVIRVGHTDFRADVSTISRITKRSIIPYRWGATRAPWFQYLGQKAINLAKAKDVVSLAALTSGCRATDPRDRIFAITQLLVDAKLRENLAPDYTLSFQHFSIGFFAHSLLVARKFTFLDHAGLVHSSSTPSWVPECRSHGAWERALSNAIPRRYNISPYSEFQTHDCQVYLDEESSVTLRELISVYDYDPAYIKPAVDAANGALLMDLTHLFEFETRPVLGRSYSDLKFYNVNHRSNHLRTIPPLFIAWTELNIEIGDHLFVLPTNEKIEDQLQFGDRTTTISQSNKYDTGGMIYLVLRPRKSQQGLRTFSLVTTRLALCAQNPSGHDWPRSVAFHGSDWPGLRNISFLRLSEVQSSVASAITSILNILLEAKRSVFTQEQQAHLTGLPTDHGAKSRSKAAAICSAFYRDDKGARDLQFHMWGHLGSVLIDANFHRAFPKKTPPMVQAMREFLQRNNIKMLMNAMIDSYKPFLMLDDLEALIRAGPLPEQRFIGIPKYINGIKVDGSIGPVLIV